MVASLQKPSIPYAQKMIKYLFFLGQNTSYEYYEYIFGVNFFHLDKSMNQMI
jgi:hypothetical protein